jgi:hypothetical protein
MNHRTLPSGEREATTLCQQTHHPFHKAPRAENNGDNYYVVE